MTRPARPAAAPPDVVGRALAATFAVLARARGGRALHPHGAVLDAELTRHGAATRWGVPWLDEPGTETGMARMSRATGLPHGWPDVLGLALRLGAGGGDLLLATTGRAPVLRHLLTARTEANAAYTSLLPYATPRGTALLAALPAERRHLPAEGEPLARAVAARPLSLLLAVARPLGPWEPFGTLRLSIHDEHPLDPLDPPTAFDPVLNPLPGLPIHPLVVRLREPSYAAVRAARGVSPGRPG